MSDAEARYDRVRRRVGLWLAPLLFVALWSWPMPELSIQAHRLAAVGALTVTLWITEAIPLPAAALAGPALAALLGVCTATAAFAPFSHPVIYLFMGGFLLAAALGRHGFDRRAALWLIARSWIGGSPRRAVIALAVVGFVFSMWISNTAATAMLLPVALGLHATIARALQKPASELHVFGGGMVLSMAYATSLGGMATPIGTAPNVIALSLLEKQTHERIDFIGWMLFGVPTALVLLAIMLFVMLRRFPAPTNHVGGLQDQVHRELAELGPMCSAERRTLGVFGLALVGWLSPSVFRLVLGDAHPVSLWAKSNLDEGVVAILSASLLFLVPAATSNSAPSHGTSSTRLLGWEDAQGLDWGTLLLLGGGLSLGGLAFDTGLAEALGRGFLALGGDFATTEWGLVATGTLLVLLLTEVTSNTAATNMMLPVIIGAAQATNQEPHAAVIATTFSASCAFMLPVSTPPNAMAYGTRMLRIPDMIRAGVRLDFWSYFVLLGSAFVLLPILRN